MKNDRRMAVLYILIAIIFAIVPFVGTLSNQLAWLAALIFLGLGIYRLSKIFKKSNDKQ
jgi:FtsH-binding integral membrane protein